MTIRDRRAMLGDAYTIIVGGVRIPFDETGACRDATPDQVAAAAATPTRRERFEVVENRPSRLGRRRHFERQTVDSAPENAPSVTSADEAPKVEEELGE